MRKRILALLCAALCVFSLAACGGGSSPEDRIKRVVKTYYTCPDKKLLEMADEIDEAWGDKEKIDPLVEEYQAYLETVYKAEDFSKERYQNIAADMVFGQGLVPIYCLRAGAETKVKSVTVAVETELAVDTIYAYTVEVELKKDGTTTQVTETGRAYVSVSDGVITSLTPSGTLLRELM